jgi:hypothetical protein
MSNFFLESTHDSNKKIARVSAVISASQQEIFALLANHRWVGKREIVTR